jgi:hypothetical protein
MSAYRRLIGNCIIELIKKVFKTKDKNQRFVLPYSKQKVKLVHLKPTAGTKKRHLA